MAVTTAPVSEAPNHPSALAMGVVAFTAHNVIVGSIFGTTGVLLKPMAERLDVTLEMASAGAPMVIVGSAVLSSVAGVLAGRFTLRVLLLVSALVMALGWFLLGATQSFAMYLIAYGACLGPAMAIGGVVLPPTLITRWFNQHRGLAIGLAHMSLVIAFMPIVGNWLIETYGLTVTFYALAAFMLATLLPAALLLKEYPPNYVAPAASELAGATSNAGLSIGALFTNVPFWMLALAVAAPNTSSVLLGVHLVTMAESWGFTRGQGALLASMMALAGMGGFVLFGWICDKLGGARTLALLAFDAAVLWALLLIDLPFAGRSVVICLIGVHGAGSIPALSKALAETLGPETFSRAYGLSATVTLPLTILAVIGTGTVARVTGSYTLVILGIIVFFAVAFTLALLAARARKGPPTVAMT